MKMRKGSRPEGPGWFFKPISAERVNWTLCYKQAGAGVSWTEIKIVANDPAPYKGNFYLSWNGGRFAKSRDAKILNEQHTELHTIVVNLLQSIDSEIFLKGAKERIIPEQEKLTEMDLLAKHNPELYATIVKELDAIKSEKTTEEHKVNWINLGSVGAVTELERDLLVFDTPSDTNRVEVRLSTSEGGVPTTTYFFAEEDNGGVKAEGVLLNSLKNRYPEVWFKAQELLIQYFREKDFY